MTGPGFNPMGNIFDKTEGGVLEQERQEMLKGDVHTTGLYGDEGLAHGGEAIDPATGLPNVNMEEDVHAITPTIRTVPEETHGDIMGDIPDPSTMTLEELLATQKEG